MANKNNNSNYRDIKYIKLAYEQAMINLGSTSLNPSVGCVIVKKNSVISSGYTSFNGRPHAEVNALSKKRNDYKDSEMYITLEPCSHYGKTPPCIEKIINKKIKRVVFSITDTDPRSKKKAEKKLNNKKISVKKNVSKNLGKEFYKSYFLQSSNLLPFIDAKLAISKDFFTINRNEKWITNFRSRRLGNFMRSRYDCLVTTSKTINDDNPLLDCRVEGLEKKSPALFIIDRSFNIKKNSNIFKKKDRRTYILTNKKNPDKENFLKKRGVKIIQIIRDKNIDLELKNIFYLIKKLGFNRVLIECGTTFLNQILQHNLIKNFYLFRSSKVLKSKGHNNSTFFFIKKAKISKKNIIKVNLNEDSLYKVKL